MTAPAKPMIDELINYARSFYADNRFNVAILSTLEAHKRITEAAGRPEPVANIIKAVHEQGCENGCGSMKHCICSYAEDLADHVEKLEAYADRVAAERDDALKATCCDAKEKNEGCYRAVTAERQLAACQKECKEQARLNGMGSEREARLMAQLAELQRKYDGLVAAVKRALEHTAHKREADKEPDELMRAGILGGMVISIEEDLAEALAKLNGEQEK